MEEILKMLRNFTTIVNDVINEAYESGVDLFLENLEADLKRDVFISENGMEKIMENLFLAENKNEVKSIE